MDESFSTGLGGLIEYLWRCRGWNRKELQPLTERGRNDARLCDNAKHLLLNNRRLLAPRLRRDLTRYFENKTKRLNIDAYLSRLSKSYPATLESLQEPPEILYFQGNLQILNHAGPWISVVGTRRASAYALEVCKYLIEAWEPYQPVIVSGMAEGIDGRAHRVALDCGLATIGVLGTSLDRPYPWVHKNLKKEMVRRGLLLTELFQGAPMGPWRFPERNRIIAALGQVLVVIEAPEKSGSLWTATHALELGREIYVVPGPIHHPRNRGGHALIQQGARLLKDPQEVLSGFFPPQRPLRAPGQAQGDLSWQPPNLSSRELQLWSELGIEPRHIDKLIQISDLPAPRVISLLTDWDLQGWVQELPGGMYKKINNFK